MPAKSEQQAVLFRIANALKEGKKIPGKGPARRIAKTMPKRKIQEFMVKA